VYSSPNIIRVIKLRRIGWARHVARMRRGNGHIGLWWGDLKVTSLGRPRRRLENNIKTNLPKVE
jgi:hypothetical protein